MKIFLRRDYAPSAWSDLYGYLMCCTSVYHFCFYDVFNTGADVLHPILYFLSDLSMRRVQTNGSWTFFCPSSAPSLVGCHGAAFEAEYGKLEIDDQLGVKVKARDVWDDLLRSISTGTGPSVVFADAVCSEYLLSR